MARRQRAQAHLTFARRDPDVTQPIRYPNCAPLHRKLLTRSR
ncbi:hypothetical protein OCU_25640 [Mycobacterium intracellulare ATCC 13950]|uniref:Uncharacterized protein n=1 Tax=Mycobacterium intracellulare (strain ATCC 13950 / DSM 43223 / JCM 6384 / NCTC 13025 / 3600) TaxID=487521 RepID=H8IL81_MYCIA|nr:hypothetical protein OCU_25640 [Mycobacterium intracellulare ATCC 13950]